MKRITENFMNWLLCSIVIIGIFISFNLISASNVKANENSIEKISGVSETTGVKYETIYVSGTKYIVFMGPTGDIEVVRY